MLRALMIRFGLPTLLLLFIATWFTVPFVENILAGWFRTDVELRAQLVMNSVEVPLAQAVDQPNSERLARSVSRATADERLLAVLACRADGVALYRTEQTPAPVNCGLALIEDDQQAGRLVKTQQGAVLVSRFDRVTPRGQPYRALIVHDMSFVDRRQSAARDYLIAFLLLSGLMLIALTVALAWLLLRRWGRVLISDIRGQKFRDASMPGNASIPVLSQVRKVLREIEHNQRMELDYHENWTPRALQHLVAEQMGAPRFLVVSNREPYIHNEGPHGQPVVQVPASGMVAALEPVIRACSGTWIAHGSGNADRKVVDINDHVRVPPQDPAYTLRRVWLDEQEESGYYYGFSNEGLWPLCHLAYVRPAFRPDDWDQYEKVNRRFADVVAREARDERPVVFVQDYHFALLPAMVRARVPGATIALFWHIPWPNAETFGVCPWKEELLQGLLQSDILGFHTQYHCQNFLATCDRFIECQIDRELMTVTVQGHVCRVSPYPISIEWPPRFTENMARAELCRTVIQRRFGLRPEVAIGIGVERWDFTKGILERFAAIEVLLEQEPALIGKVTLLQVAAPTRSRLPAYKTLRDETHAAAERINARFGRDDWKPIILIAEHQEGHQVFELYRAADFCLVNSLHDGMNLVAKEFVAAREDDDGVLVLSTFAGASRELIEALSVNPYDIRQTAAAISAALKMPREERRERMQLMRQTVKQNNVYRWAGRILMDAMRVRRRQQLARPTAERTAPQKTRLLARLTERSTDEAA